MGDPEAGRARTKAAAPPRTGGHAENDPVASEPPPDATQPPAAQAEAGPPQYDDPVVNMVAAKVFVDWLRNRHQLLFPFALNLKKLDGTQIGLLLNSMVAAAQADGPLDEKKRERIESAMELIEGDEEHRRLLASTLERPQRLFDVLAAVKDVQTGAVVYAGALLAADRRKAVNRHYLRYISARLQLPPDLARSLEQRFRAL
jgi:uncharacterized membrane protein YebE (DUF533 family)